MADEEEVPVEETETETKPEPTPKAKAKADPNEGFRAALKARNDDAIGMARDLYNEANTARKEADAIRKKLPGEGSVVLSADDAAAWASYRKLGKPDDIAKDREEHGTLKTKQAARERKDLILKAASLHDFDADALMEMSGLDSLELRIKKVDRNGKPTDVAQVKSTDDEGKEKWTTLDEFAKTAWPKSHAILKKAGPQVSHPPLRTVNTDRHSLRDESKAQSVAYKVRY